MTAAVDKRRGNSLWKTLVADPYRKLAAIGLAAALYYFLDTQVNSTHAFDLALMPVDEAASPTGKYGADVLQVAVPKAKVTVLSFRDAGSNAPIDRVTLQVKGPNYAVDNARRRTQPFNAGAFKAIEWTSSPGFDFTVADLVKDPNLQNLELTMTPSRVHLDLEQNIERPVPLTKDKVALSFPNTADEARLKNRLLENWKFSAETIRVRGPRRQVEALGADGRTPFRAVVTPSSDDSRVTGTIELNSDAASPLNLQLDAGVVVTVPVHPEPLQLQLDIPLLIDDRSLPPALRGRYWPNLEGRTEGLPTKERPDLYQSLTVDVNVSGSLKLVLGGLEAEAQARYAKEHMRMLLWIPPLAPDSPAEPAKLGPVEARLELVTPQGRLIDSPDCQQVKVVAMILELHK